METCSSGSSAASSCSGVVLTKSFALTSASLLLDFFTKNDRAFKALMTRGHLPQAWFKNLNLNLTFPPIQETNKDRQVSTGLIGVSVSASQISLLHKLPCSIESVWKAPRFASTLRSLFSDGWSFHENPDAVQKDPSPHQVILDLLMCHPVVQMVY